MNIILDASGNVLMWSETGTLTADKAAGQQCFELTDEQVAAFLQRPPNDGMTFINGVFGWIAPPPAPPPLTVDQKLAQIGLSVAVLSAALNITAQPAPPAQQDSPAS
jgi:hypothetical protein